MKKLFFFKWQLPILIIANTLLSCTNEQSQETDTPTPIVMDGKYIHRNAGNPYLPLWEHLPDGEPRVFEDPDNPGKYRIYIVGSHDVNYTSYCGLDIRAWSAPVENLSAWRDEGPIFTHEIEGKADIFYAPDLVELVRKNGKKEYYLYPHSRGHKRQALVAKGDRPDGPFTIINGTKGNSEALPESIIGFDPAVYIDYVTDSTDPDYEIGFRAYGYWGFRHSQAAQLDQNTMYSIRPGHEPIDYFIPAGETYGELRDPKGTTYPNVFPGEDLGQFNFFEAASIRKIGNKYVWVYSGFSGPEYGLSSTNSALRYAYGDTPLGPWKSGGVLVDSRAPVLNKDGEKLETSYSGHNTHGSIELINDQWYAFYHRAPRSFGYARQATVAPVSIEWDETPVAEGGKVRICGYDPYMENNKWTAKDNHGLEYKGAEVTSEGFHIYGLDPYQYYSAGYACYLSNLESQQDSWDIWDNNMPISDVKNGDIIGYKYFGFGGLAEAKKGLKAFDGSEPGNNTAFNLFITPKSNKAFKVNVWLNGPWENEQWNGIKLGEIAVPANAAKEISKYTLDVSNIIDNLQKKHAIFLSIEGANDEDICDIIGLGFSKQLKDIIRPVPPTVNIFANGTSIILPEHPIRSTNENGIIGYKRYSASYKMEENVDQIPKVTATSDNNLVKISIEQAKSLDKAAIVKFDYLGVVKTYELNFIQK